MNKQFLIFGFMAFAIVFSLTPSSAPMQGAGKVAYAMSFYNGLTTFFEIELNTGQMIQLSTYPGIEGIDAFVATVDLETQRYFQPAIDSTFTRRLLIIDTKSGDLVASPPFSTVLSVLEYNPKDGYLYGVTYDYNLTSNTLVKIDPETLHVNLLTSIQGINGVFAGVSALDSEYFFFEGTSSRGNEIYSINIQTLEVTSTLLSSGLLHFIIVNNNLIGVTFADPVNQLVHIDLSTGEQTIISQISEIEALFQGAAIFDSEKNWYIFPVVDKEYKQRLFIFDIQTGELVGKPELTVSPIATALNLKALSFGGQIKSFERGQVNYYKVYLPFVIK
ncbi:DUF6923 family protein [Caldilinea aerophila]|uniref:DUF6923 domain-containing protein n=1 Tax=Caldilinea aerophila (strain DSM 14535 / JCM 11387 / NBRC 104270 / STL-6-O1) TaxID=926550 RepID=I0I4H1_CALAS|nr:hypothetical protein [Caldilinea aerophila]BAM00159.1 hypothetical protein CLDAP_21190 [Caldilinea aerophila DSM 14535 = NBRC 104270]